MARTTEERKLANAECARQSRKRKNEQLEQLQREVDSYKRRICKVENENASLRQSIYHCSTAAPSHPRMPRMDASSSPRVRQDDQYGLILGIHADLDSMETDLGISIAQPPAPVEDPSPAEGGTSLAMIFGTTGGTAQQAKSSGTKSESLTATESRHSSVSTAANPPCNVSIRPLLQTATTQLIHMDGMQKSVVCGTKDGVFRQAAVQACPQQRSWVGKLDEPHSVRQPSLQPMSTTSHPESSVCRPTAAHPVFSSATKQHTYQEQTLPGAFVPGLAAVRGLVPNSQQPISCTVTVHSATPMVFLHTPMSLLESKSSEDPNDRRAPAAGFEESGFVAGLLC